MNGKTFLGIVAGVALVYVGYKAFCGNRLIGAFNSGESGTSKVKEKVSMTDEKKIELMGELSNLEAKMYGMIETSQSQEEIKKEIDAKVSELKAA